MKTDKTGLDNGAGKNEDRQLWQESDNMGHRSIHVTKDGGIGINVGGMVYVKPLKEWHKLATEKSAMEKMQGQQGGVLREELANLEHKHWSSWQSWYHQVLRERCSSKIMEKVLARWEKQIATDYKDLPERERDMDRKEADKTLEVLSRHPQSDGLLLEEIMCDLLCLAREEAEPINGVDKIDIGHIRPVITNAIHRYHNRHPQSVEAQKPTAPASTWRALDKLARYRHPSHGGDFLYAPDVYNAIPYRPEKPTADKGLWEEVKEVEKEIKSGDWETQKDIATQLGWICSRYTLASPEKSTQGQGDRGGKCEWQEDNKNCTAKKCPYSDIRGTTSDGTCILHPKPIKINGKELPKGRTCRSCLHTAKCKQLGVYNLDSTMCDWDPCRYAEYHGDMALEPMFMREVCEALGWQGGTVHDAIKEIMRLKSITHRTPSPDPQTQVQQLIQFAKDNGYGLAAEWMVGMTGKTMSEDK